MKKFYTFLILVTLSINVIDQTPVITAATAKIEGVVKGAGN